MDIFIGNLPLDTSAVDLRKLLGSTGINIRYRIYRKTLKEGAVKCYGHAVVEPDELALALIQQLSDTVLQDYKIEIRPLAERSHANDRRGPLWSGAPWMGLDRRKADRRGKT